MAQDHVVSNQMTAQQRKASRLFGRHIIKKRLQFKFGFIVFLFLSLACFAQWHQTHWVVGRLIENGTISGLDAINQLHYLNQVVMYTSILAVAIVFGLSLFFSHFIAGPIYRMEKTFEQMKDGDLSMVVRFRKHDELQDTALLFNQALTSIRSKLGEERKEISLSFEKVREVSELLRQAGRNDEASQLDRIIIDQQNSPTQIKI